MRLIQEFLARQRASMGFADDTALPVQDRTGATPDLGASVRFQQAIDGNNVLPKFEDCVQTFDPYYVPLLGSTIPAPIVPRGAQVLVDGLSIYCPIETDGVHLNGLVTVFTANVSTLGAPIGLNPGQALVVSVDNSRPFLLPFLPVRRNMINAGKFTVVGTTSQRVVVWLFRRSGEGF